jgi:hypothetical protein
MIRSAHSRRDDRGVVALEVVLVMPVLLILIIGTVMVGNYWNLKTQASGLARDGARDAALLAEDLPDGTVIVEGGCDASSNPLEDTVTVLATKTVTLRSLPLLPDLLPATIEERVTMRCGG